jgi:hypothetical protein
MSDRDAPEIEALGIELPHGFPTLVGATATHVWLHDGDDAVAHSSTWSSRLWTTP